MSNKRSLFAAFATALLVVGAFSTGAVAVGTQSVDGLAVDVNQSEDVVVTVTDNGTAVVGANVTVAPVDENASIGVGEYTTDANGTVTLATPAENVTVDVTAADGDETVTTTVTLLSGEADEGGLAVAVSQTEDVSVHVTDNGTDVANASVAVDAPVVNNSTYAGAGDHTTDANGTVDLPAPEENVTVDVTATVGNETASTTATLVVASEEPESFGDRVSAFVAKLLSGEDGENDAPLGQLISEFVTENNPGAEKRPDHAGPGGEDDENDDRRGPPEHAGGDEDDDDRRGPPAHAGPGGDDESDEEEEDDDGDEERQASLGSVVGFDY